MLYELGSNQNKLSPGDRARLRYMAAKKLSESFPELTRRELALEVGLRYGSTVSYGLTKLDHEAFLRQLTARKRTRLLHGEL